MCITLSPYDGKYILDGARFILCQSNAKIYHLKEVYPHAEINPLGDWTGGTDVDTGATNRKLGNDMADSVTGGGLHGKDLSKADVSVNIYAWLKARKRESPWSLPAPLGTIPWTAFPMRRSWRLPGNTSSPLAALRNLRNGGWCDENNNGNAAGANQQTGALCEQRPHPLPGADYEAPLLLREFGFINLSSLTATMA